MRSVQLVRDEIEQHSNAVDSHHGDFSNNF